ncbi:MAG TPA: hypothetical protein VLO12_06705 [Halomonas sp.]|nr:hypothetical protein [Halomonas sp.]
MLKLIQDDVTIEVKVWEEEQEPLDAIVLPATDKQRSDLGRAAVGQAWMAWSPIASTTRMIKFMPPTSWAESERCDLLQSYRFAIRVAENHEIASLSLPLPCHAGLGKGDEKLAAALSRTVLAQCRHLNHLRHVRLLGSEEQEVILYANQLVEEQKVNNG